MYNQIHPMYVQDPIWEARGGYRPGHHMVPYKVPFFPPEEPPSPRATKHDQILKPLKELSKADSQFKESEDGSSYVLILDLPGMDRDKVSVSVSGKQVSIKGAVKNEESWETQDGVTSRSVNSSTVTRSYVAPGPVFGAKVKSQWDGSRLAITLPKAPPGTICDDAMDEGEGGEAMTLTAQDSGKTLLDVWNNMEQEMETMMRPFDADFPSFGHKLTPEERKSIEEHHAKEEEAKEKLRQAYQERRVKEEEIRAKRVMIARRRNMYTELERDGDVLKLTVLVPEGTDSSMCSMAVEEDRFGRRYLLVDAKGPDGTVVKERKLPLSDEIDPNSVSAKFDDKEGKLNVVLMHRKPKQISIDIMKD